MADASRVVVSETGITAKVGWDDHVASFDKLSDVTQLAIENFVLYSSESMESLLRPFVDAGKGTLSYDFSKVQPLERMYLPL